MFATVLALGYFDNDARSHWYVLPHAYNNFRIAVHTRYEITFGYRSGVFVSDAIFFCKPFDT